MSTTPKQKTNSAGIFPMIAIPLAFIMAYIIYKFIFGAGSHFKGGDNHNDPNPGDYLGVIYKGGFIVPILLGLLIITVVFCIERFITINKAQGSGPIDKFVKNVQYSISKGDVTGAISACDKQKGSVANVVRSGVQKFDEMARDTKLAKDQKIIAIQKEVEEATTLELPMLEQNLPILATIASVATLIGLIGTVLGMIKAFAALAQSGAPDASALATGISEALINTALGITTSAIAIVFYNFFTTKIDGLTYRIDEAGYSLQQQFASQHG